MIFSYSLKKTKTSHYLCLLTVMSQNPDLDFNLFVCHIHFTSSVSHSG